MVTFCFCLTFFQKDSFFRNCPTYMTHQYITISKVGTTKCNHPRIIQFNDSLNTGPKAHFEWTDLLTFPYICSLSNLLTKPINTFVFGSEQITGRVGLKIGEDWSCIEEDTKSKNTVITEWTAFCLFVPINCYIYKLTSLSLSLSRRQLTATQQRKL